ncbi:basic proline-rich protein-like [Bos javanicus]|uniref:basic proline-rich protein-like n=1 Tax=Bos javanicus TaxID=9906 RepID=UPI002AA93415|nr:basic proline-rich protein-like [Bos javanicus]
MRAAVPSPPSGGGSLLLRAPGPGPDRGLGRLSQWVPRLDPSPAPGGAGAGPQPGRIVSDVPRPALGPPAPPGRMDLAAPRKEANYSVGAPPTHAAPWRPPDPEPILVTVPRPGRALRCRPGERPRPAERSAETGMSCSTWQNMTTTQCQDLPGTISRSFCVVGCCPYRHT